MKNEELRKIKWGGLGYNQSLTNSDAKKGPGDGGAEEEKVSDAA